MTGLCGDCKFIIQAETSLVCGHSKANVATGGRGLYTYPPARFECDIELFERRDPKKEYYRQMHEMAAENGWFASDKANSSFGDIIHYFSKTKQVEHVKREAVIKDNDKKGVPKNSATGKRKAANGYRV